MKRDDFRQFLREFYSGCLTEAEDPSSLTSPEDKGETSLDDQVDRLLLSYEKEARDIKKESHDYRSFSRRFLLEADEDEKAEGDKKDDEEPSETPKGSSDDIKIDEFAESVVRLIDNYDSLLNVRDTLVRRAQEFLEKNYDEETVSSFKSVMRDTFDVEVGVSDIDKQEKFQPPPAARAGGTGGGGG